MKILNKSKFILWIILADVLCILVSVAFVFVFLPLTTQNPLEKYSLPILFYLLFWFLFSFLFGRYKRNRRTTFFIEIFRIFYTSILILGIFALYILIEPHSSWSENVLFFISIGLFVLLYFVYFVHFAYRYAISYEISEFDSQFRKNATPHSEILLSEDASKERKYRIIESSDEKVYQFLKENVNLDIKNTFLSSNLDITAIEDILTFEYSTIVQLRNLNNIRGINKLFFIANEKLPVDGMLVCCYKSKSTTKKNILKKYNRFLGNIVYFFYFFYHRMFPKFFLTRRLYYDFTKGKKRTLSKTEVLGRLNYCGFEPIKQAKIGDSNFIISKRIRNSKPLILKNYGALIKLRRTGKDGKMFNVYKFRTMHPYAEYIQEYIHKTSNLAEGGKFNKDIRITTLGRFMRKYWLDELPMLLNLLKGEMKLIGVRPLSKHYFSLYNKDLQEKRILFKPGLLPPFYADMPKTLEEIQASEMKYLTECETKGTFATDVKYFFLIINNILFKKARSA